MQDPVRASAGGSAAVQCQAQSLASQNLLQGGVILMKVSGISTFGHGHEPATGGRTGATGVVLYSPLITHLHVPVHIALSFSEQSL